MLGLSIAILILSILDACFTLCHISWANGREVNPLMNWFLQNWGTVGFVSVKMIMTIFGLTAILYLNQFTSWAKQGLQFLLIAYAILIVYHLFLAIRFW